MGRSMWTAGLVSFLMVCIPCFLSSHVAAQEMAEPKTPNEAADVEASDGLVDVTQTIRIVDARTKEPLSDCKVILTKLHCNHDQGEYKVVSKSKIDADEDGEFNLVLKKEELGDPNFHLIGRVKSQGYHQFELNVGSDPEQEAWQDWFDHFANNDIELHKLKTVNGRVVDAEGNPIVAAKINASQWLGGYNRQEVYTDVDGLFELELSEIVNPETEVQIRISSSTHEQKYFAFPEYGDDLGDLELVPGTRVVGQVLDARGNPISNIGVTLQALNGQFRGSVSVMSDAQGRFDFGALPAESYLVRIDERKSVELDGVFVGSKAVDMEAVFFDRQFQVVADENDRCEVVVQAVPHVYVRGQFIGADGQLLKDGDYAHFSVAADRLMNNTGRSLYQAGENGRFEIKFPHGSGGTIFLDEDNEIQLPGREKEWYLLGSNTRIGPVNEDLEGIKIFVTEKRSLLVRLQDADGKEQHGVVGGAYVDVPVRGTLNGLDAHFLLYNFYDGNGYQYALRVGKEMKIFAVVAGYEKAEKVLTLESGEEPVEITLTLTKAADE